jgi:transketolase
MGQVASSSRSRKILTKVERSMDAVQRAHSGHPRPLLALAPVVDPACR